MAVTVKKAVLWRRELDNQPGTLAEALKPFANARINLQVVMGYVLPGDRTKAALEIYPVTSKKAEAAAKAGGLQPATTIYSLVVEGDDRVGLGHEVADSLAKANVNISFAVIEVVGKKYLGIFGFDSEQAANKAAVLIKATGKKVAVRRKALKATKAGKKAGTLKKVSRKAPAKRTSVKKTTVRAKSSAKKASGKKSRKSSGKRK